MPRISGGCLCGAVRYESAAQPSLVVVCHCATCQKNTGSAFSLNLAMPRDAVTITGDSLTTYEDDSGASGKLFYRSFCGRCGSPISGQGEAYPNMLILKAGTLDDPSWVKPEGHIWCVEKQPWLSIEPGVLQVPGASP
jgi:hypothetical protein